MSVKIWRDGNCISRSKNLRGLIRHGHAAGVRLVKLDHVEADNSAVVTVSFADWAHCQVHFASICQARRFFEKRQRKWGGEILEGKWPVVNRPGGAHVRNHL